MNKYLFWRVATTVTRDRESVGQIPRRRLLKRLGAVGVGSVGFSGRGAAKTRQGSGFALVTNTYPSGWYQTAGTLGTGTVQLCGESIDLTIYSVYGVSRSGTPNISQLNVTDLELKSDQRFYLHDPRPVCSRDASEWYEQRMTTK